MEIIEQIVALPRGEERAPALLLVHGAWRNAAVWRPLAEELAQRGRRGTAISLPGHGASTMHKGDVAHYTVQDAARTIAAELARHREPAVLVAHDVNCVAALRAAGMQRPRALVLLSPLPASGLAGTLGRTFLRRPIWAARELVRSRFAAPWSSAPTLARELFLGSDPSVDAVTFASSLEPESRSVLGELFFRWPARPADCPTLVVSATSGPFRAHDHARLAERLAATHVTVPGAAFDLAAAPRASETAALIDGWLARLHT